MKQIRRQTIKSVFVVSAMVAAMTGCSNQVETTGNTIPSTVPASTGKVCCTPQNNANNNTYNVLDNANTKPATNNTASTNVYNPATRPNTQPATIPVATALPQQPANNNTSYYDYGGSSSATASSANYNYSNTASSSAAQPTSNDTRPAVQVLASGVYETAQGMQQQMKSAGYNAIIVKAGGLYKVRIPYGSYEEAKGRLTQVRATVPDAFVSR